MTAVPPPNGPDISFLYAIIRDMDAKLDRLIETFTTTREHAKLEIRVADLENRWRRNAGWLIALVGALSSVAYLLVYITK